MDFSAAHGKRGECRCITRTKFGFPVRVCSNPCRKHFDEEKDFDRPDREPITLADPATERERDERG